MHYNVQVTIQEVSEGQPPEVDQYNKVKTPAKERTVIEILRVNVTKESKAQAIAAATSHLEVE